MRISDWSSDVCSSDLRARPDPAELLAVLERIGVEAVVVVELEVARREITVFGDDIVALDDRMGHRAAREELKIGLAVIRIAVAEPEHDAAIEHHDAKLFLISEEHTSELQSPIRISSA